MLNAFRHLMKDHWRAPRGRGGTTDVLNAFRHLMKDHSFPCGECRAGCAVLNAFRHLMKDHSAERLRTCCDLGAQRLSASDEGSPQVAASHVPNASLCSTPFGI